MEVIKCIFLPKKAGGMTSAFLIDWSSLASDRTVWKKMGKPLPRSGTQFVVIKNIDVVTIKSGCANQYL